MSRISTPPNLTRVIPNSKTPNKTSSFENELRDDVSTPKKPENDDSKREKETGDQMKEESLSEGVVDSPVSRKKGKRGAERLGAVGTRSSPRSHAKRGKQGEAHTKDDEKTKKGDGKDEKPDVVIDKTGEEKATKTTKHSRQPKARKVIKYLDDDEEESETGGNSIKGTKAIKEQTVLTATVTASLSCASPNKKKSPSKMASPSKQRTPEREGCLVKQPGLTFDKELSASPVKKSKQQQQQRSRMNDRVTHKTTSPVKPVSSPVKPVSSPVKLISSPVKPVSKPVSSPSKPVSSLTQSVSTPRSFYSSSKPTTPASANRPSTTTTPSATTPKVSRGNSYRNYMNRGGPKAPGSKVVPEGEENCFEGLTFVITGVLESLERDEAADIVKRLLTHTYYQLPSICTNHKCV